jgi:uracil-DNA glycosylase
MSIGDGKKVRYHGLVEARKACRACTSLTNPSTSLTNPSVCEDGKYDCDAIGSWSAWQGNLDAPLMLVGQDWGDVQWFVREEGRSTDTSRTNKTLLRLLASIGFELKLPSETPGDGVLFFTNAVLCLKDGGAQASVPTEWFRNCGTRFLRPTIELVQPKIVVCLGERAYRAVLGAWEIKARKFSDAVTLKEPVALSPLGPWVFPVYHCGARTQIMNRNLEAQLEDWKRIGEFLSPAKASDRDIHER